MAGHTSSSRAQTGKDRARWHGGRKGVSGKPSCSVLNLASTLSSSLLVDLLPCSWDLTPSPSHASYQEPSAALLIFSLSSLIFPCSRHRRPSFLSRLISYLIVGQEAPICLEPTLLPPTVPCLLMQVSVRTTRETLELERNPREVTNSKARDEIN